MALAVVYSRASVGVKAPLVIVEVHLSPGMAAFNLVGLPETAVKESKDRVRSAIINSKLEFPDKRITINLAPADLPKEGGRFDLPIALGILAASGQIPKTILEQYEFIGELALSGELRSVRGILPVVLQTHKHHRELIVPEKNAKEAGLVKQGNVWSATHLLDVCAFLHRSYQLPRCENVCSSTNPTSLDLADVKGQKHAKRALEIAAAGKHSLLLIGPPGTGKTMLANRIISILPELSEEQGLEAAAIASSSSEGFNIQRWCQIPFRAPHHSSSSVALVGGGRPLRPGEISLAHHGILFLDELPEFSRYVLDCLREPLESGHVTISRAAFQIQFPAQFQLLAAMNPCLCGNAGNVIEQCECQPQQVKKYMGKISGPLRDRIEMQVEVPKMAADEITGSQSSSQEEGSIHIKSRVLAAREIQWQRQGKWNAQLNSMELQSVTKLSHSTLTLLNEVMMKFNLSARVYHKILKVARTIADLENSDQIQDQHVSEVLTYRSLDRQRI